MLMIVFYVGEDRYAFECEHILEVIPKVNLKDIPHSPHYISGMLNFHGLPVPVIDLCELIQKRPCPSRLHSRIVVLKYPSGEGEFVTVGVLAEKMTETGDYKIEEFIDGGMQMQKTPYLGGTRTDSKGMIQRFLLGVLVKILKETVIETSEDISDVHGR